MKPNRRRRTFPGFLRIFMLLMVASRMLAASPRGVAEDKTRERKDEVGQLTEPAGPGNENTGLLRVAERPKEPGKLYRLLGYGLYASSAADLASTEWGLERRGLVEANPLMANRSVRISAHVVAPAVTAWATDEVSRRGHEKLALYIRLGFTVLYSYAVIHNLRTIHGP